jgi:hypothetical protein
MMRGDWNGTPTPRCRLVAVISAAHGGSLCIDSPAEAMGKSTPSLPRALVRLRHRGGTHVGEEEIEISSLDLRYESYRLKSRATEKALLASIAENGIRDPLQGVDDNDARILLDGFKRYRCAKHLGIAIVPYHSLGSDQPLAIITLLRLSNARSLSILEQAKLIDELKTVHHMSTGEIGGLLERSPSWVSVRTGILQEMSELVMEKIFAGEFPPYAYMYTLRQFMRINKVTSQEIEEFVGAVSGKKLSIRDIDLLAHGYFKGAEDFRQQIRSGNLLWGLAHLKEITMQASGCTHAEKRMLNDLQIVQKYMQRVTVASRDPRLRTNAFYSQANLLAAAIVGKLQGFSTAMREFHDRSGQAEGHLVSP